MAVSACTGGDAAPLNIPDGAKVIVLGDSWSTGFAAAPGKGYVDDLTRDMDWTAEVVPDGAGTGFLNAGSTDAGTYAERLSPMPEDATVDLVLIQGGLNDRGADSSQLEAAITETVEVAQEKYPEAQIIGVGPLEPVKFPPSPTVGEIDATFAEVAEDMDVPYVSPSSDEWFDSVDDLTQYIDADQDFHPNTAGHAYFADRLARAINDLSD